MTTFVNATVKMRLDATTDRDEQLPDHEHMERAIRRELEGLTIYWPSGDERFPPAVAGPCAIIDEIEVEQLEVE